MREKKKMQSFRLHPAILRDLKRLAEEHHCTQTAILEQALHRFVQEQDRQPQNQP